MTVQQLKTLLHGFPEDMEVLIADYSDDSDEVLKAMEVKGVEQITQEGIEPFVCVHTGEE